MMNDDELAPAIDGGQYKIAQRTPIHEPPAWQGDHMQFKALQKAAAGGEDEDDDAVSDAIQSEDDRASDAMSTISDIQEQVKQMDATSRATLVDRIKRFSSRHGVRARTVNADWPSDDLEEEMRRLQSEVALQRSMKFQRRMLLTFTSGVEYIHTKTPLNGKLDGWGEAVLQQVDDYDDVFERLHEKHAPKLGVAGMGKQEEPEMALLRMLAYSAFTHAVTTSIAKMAMAPTQAEARREVATARMKQATADSNAFIRATQSTPAKRTVSLT